MRRMLPMLLLTSATLLATSVTSAAQTITLPPSGDNQRSEVIQQIGLVRASIEYSSPDVHGPTGEDRRGKIWGTLVPWGIHDLGFNNAKGPWRAGANENTVFSVSHDVKIEGQPLPAGRYGLHMLAGESEWTIIFSKNSTSWGSFTYNPAEDALRVTVKPAKSAYHEWLTYDFIDRKPDRATVALMWEELSVPFTISVDNISTLYVDNIRRELRSAPGFNWQQWDLAAQYCLIANTNLNEALTWSENAIALAGSRPGEFRHAVDEGADSQQAVENERGRCRDGHRARPARCPADPDPSIRPPAAHAGQAQGSARGVSEECEAFR